MASLSRELARWVDALRYEDLPPAVVDRAKGVTLHCLASVLVGSQTVLCFLREAYPINHFLEMAVFALLALNLTLSRGGWWIDVTAGLTFAVAALTLESGVLVWVVIAAAWLCGLRGVSTRGLILVSALLAGYAYLRFGYLDTGMPSLTERSSGFFFERLERDELQARFGEAPLVFYVYNVVVSLLAVLFSEPRDGMFVATRAWLDGDVAPRVYLGVGSSLAMTLLIGGAAVSAWRRRASLELPDRIATVAAVVIVANAVLAFAYTKDDIVAIAGAFYALMAFTATRWAIRHAQSGGPIRTIVATAALAALATAWTVRSTGVHHVVTEHAFRTRNDWAVLPLEWQRDGQWPTDARRLALIETLRNEALRSRIPNPNLAPEWRQQWYGD